MFMNKDQVQGKIKDIAGRVERQADEWTGDKEKQVHGAAKQVKGKVQNAWGNVKEAGKQAVDNAQKTNAPADVSDESIETADGNDTHSRRKVS
jgi:uncharacterized protein YjbJ (UPF0337 family)